MNTQTLTNTTGRFGLIDRYVQTIRDIVYNNPAVKQAVVFGSRAKGNYRSGSDVDIALYGNLSHSDAGHIQYRLNEETKIPLFFDVVVYNLLENQSIKEHIDRVGLPIEPLPDR